MSNTSVVAKAVKGTLSFGRYCSYFIRNLKSFNL